jgi:hypothetical protein
MTMDNRDPVRAEFEKWWFAEGQYLDEKGGVSVENDCWIGWQARAAISTPASSSVDMTERSGEAVRRPPQETER